MSSALHRLADSGFRAGVILADPPWRFRVWSRKTGLGRSADRHYATMTLEAIKALPVQRLAGKDCAQFLWTTWPFLTDALAMIDAWGFQYRSSAFIWVKLNPKGVGYAVGTGYGTRKNTEVCLYTSRGHPQRQARDVRELIIAPRREHSRKPEELYGRIERLYPGPYLELFGREPRPGWTVWGREPFAKESFCVTLPVRTRPPEVPRLDLFGNPESISPHQS